MILNIGGVECTGVARGDDEALGHRDRCDVVAQRWKAFPRRSSCHGETRIRSLVRMAGSRSKALIRPSA